MGLENLKGDRDGVRSTLVAAVALTFFGMSVAAFADTYNFYFSKPNKKKGAVETAPLDTDYDANPDVAREDAETPPPPPVEKKPAVPEGSEGVQRTSTPPPIIINNHVHGYPPEQHRSGTSGNVPFNPPDSSAYTPEERPPAKPIGSTPKPSSTMTTVARPVDEERSRWRFGISALAVSAKPIRNVALGDFNNRQTGGGLIGTLGVDFTRSVGMNVYGGPVRDPVVADWEQMRPLLGVEFQFTPFRLNVGSFDLLELGFLAGASNLMGSILHSDAMHFGARFNLNFGSTFGLTAVGRLNGQYTMLEAGLITRI